ncbi:General substrate transporter [Cordyceps fumosorosea ARSEF 2679]|uniref:General substrate transporter n=1 Tax=Cordyceps fumosorosea (strain ARSEF 2679) TaxID=1081104 RepID=A0A167V2T9_CORFA|nr:General substrate transporter [Cordyceps fumosorosea ARSEF 2679]OAA62173.1 General substrate transporter [Cordyceps fumosorosea ARSEF 2679]
MGNNEVQKMVANSSSREAGPDTKIVPVQEKVVHGNEAFQEALLKEPPRTWAPGMVLVYLFSVVGFLCSTMNGYDASLINNLLQNHDFQATYRVGHDGLGAGIVAAMYQIGGVAVLPLVGPVIDRFGRRAGMAVGAALVIVGTILQGTAAHSGGGGQFMGGRFLLGFGVGLAASAGPVYVVEINHPAYRGVVGAIYNCLWLAGAILAAGAARGGLSVSAAFSWRLATWLQCLFSGLVLLLCPWLPESPRWLWVHGRPERARAFLVRHHGAGDADSVWPALQMREYEAALDLDGADKRWYDYSALFRNRAAAYRLVCSVSVAALAQWLGNAVLSYFLGSVLYNAGYADPVQQSNITLANNVIQFACACAGAVLVDRVGRRPLLLFSFAGCTVVWLGMTVASSRFAASYAGTAGPDGAPVYTDGDASRAALAMIFLFGAVFSVGVTPLQGLYIVEVLSFEQRAKGMAFGNLAVNAAGLLNQFAWPVSMARIGWRTYIIFTIWDAVMTVYVYFVLPETKGRTLEELDEIFAAENPVKASLAKKKLAVNQQGDVVNVAEV